MTKEADAKVAEINDRMSVQVRVAFGFASISTSLTTCPISLFEFESSLCYFGTTMKFNKLLSCLSVKSGWRVSNSPLENPSFVSSECSS